MEFCSTVTFRSSQCQIYERKSIGEVLLLRPIDKFSECQYGNYAIIPHLCMSDTSSGNEEKCNLPLFDRQYRRNSLLAFSFNVCPFFRDRVDIKFTFNTFGVNRLAHSWWTWLPTQNECFLHKNTWIDV